VSNGGEARLLAEHAVPGRPFVMGAAAACWSVVKKRSIGIPAAGTFVLLLCAAASPAWIATSGAPPIERLQGVYLQQAVEVATVGDRMVLLTRFTRFKKCGGIRGMAEEYNDHTVEILGRETPGVGFVAGVVNLIEGCTSAPAPAPQAAGGG